MGGDDEVLVFSYEKEFRGKPSTFNVYCLRDKEVRVVSDCSTDLRVVLERVAGRKRARRELSLWSSLSSHQDARKRLRVDINKVSYTLARLGAFAFSQHELTWSEFMEKGSVTLSTGTTVKDCYLYQADHIADSNGLKDVSEAVSYRLRTMSTPDNWKQK